MKFVILFLFATTLVSAQVVQDLFFIDDFTIDSPPIVIVTGESFPVSDSRTSSGPNENIIGGERNILLTVNSGTSGLVFTSGVSGGDFLTSTPSAGSSSFLVQWDGTDGSTDINPSGLGSLDFTSGGALGIRTFIQSDTTTAVSFRFYSGSLAAMCSISININGDSTTREYIVEFSSFSTGCSFTDIGAVAISCIMNSGVDIIIESISIYTTSSPSTPTRTRTRTPTRSVSPSPTPSISKSVSASSIVPGPIKYPITHPSTSTIWSLYQPACITWDASFFENGSFGSIFVEYGPSFSRSKLIANDIELSIGEVSWVVSNVYPGTARVRIDSRNDFDVYSSEFEVFPPSRRYADYC